MEDLFIQLDADGNPINHPMLLQSILWVDEKFDPNNPPKGYARFKRHWPPVVGPDETYDTHYKWIDGYVQDVFTVRTMTPDERNERESTYQQMLSRHKATISDQSVPDTSPITISPQIDVQNKKPVQVPDYSKTDTRELIQEQKIPDVHGIIVLINNIVVSFSNAVKLEPGNNQNEIFFHYAFSENKLTRLESIIQTPLESINDLPDSHDGKIGDFYVIKSPASVYAWSGSEWVKVTNNTESTSETDEADNEKFKDWKFTSPIQLDLKVDRETRNKRIEICNQCDQISVIKTCNQCGCLMPLKTWLKNSDCPLGKW